MKNIYNFILKILRFFSLYPLVKLRLYSNCMNFFMKLHLNSHNIMSFSGTLTTLFLFLFLYFFLTNLFLYSGPISQS